jgi:aryl-alcohol dehydrogenase-like predicted oxidoreductase
LTGKYDDDVPDESRMARNDRMRERFSDDMRERVRELKPIADGLGVTRAQLALAWILRQPGVSSVITGATKPAQVESNVRASAVALDEEVLNRMDELFPV